MELDELDGADQWSGSLKTRWNEVAEGPKLQMGVVTRPTLQQAMLHGRIFEISFVCKPHPQEALRKF
jgi:hypothetical protein